MTSEQWKYLTDHWGDSDEVVMGEIAKIKDTDAIETNGYKAKISEHEASIQKLQQQNIDLNKTNMNLILRLTEPGQKGGEPEPEYKAPSLSDLDAFVKEV